MHSFIRHCIGSVFLMIYFGLANAHDFWLEAHPFYTQPKKPVDISIHVGNQYVGDSLPNIVSYYQDFSLYQDGKPTEIDGELGRDPAGYFTPEQQGTYLIGYQSTWQFTDIDSDTFNKYLEQEGLDNAIRYRHQKRLSQQPVREKYIRHAKTLIQAGPDFEIDDSTTNTNYTLEITPIQNPYQKQYPQTLEFRVDFQGQPEAGLLLIGFNRQQPELAQRIRTDTHGKAKIRLDRAGDWLIKTVKIMHNDGNDADWKSHWASLTFSLQEGR